MKCSGRSGKKSADSYGGGSGSVLQDQAPLVFGQRLPLVGQEFPEFADGVAHDPLEEVVKVLPGIDSAILAGFDEAHEQGRSPATPFTADEVRPNIDR